ncbi:hypothetical protein ZWY2020_030506 [Hordeum vulgare]|nr:hypothetical protein ZWY2020_030506 [Hordeum vulgare]
MRASGMACAAWGVVILLAVLASVPPTSASTSVALASTAADDSDKGCNATALATDILKACIEVHDPMTTSCCSFILPTVDMVDCLCMVVDQPQIADSGTTSRTLFALYLRCGGKRRSGDKPYESCDDFSGSGSSTPSPATPSPPSAPKETITLTSNNEHASHMIEISTDTGVWVTALITFIGTCMGVYKWFIRESASDDESEEEEDEDEDEDEDEA